jgi:hypothetical protein
MARPAIVEKLTHHLEKEMTDEAAVVYFMVEVRKLLEHETAKTQFQVLNFYCNWVVHTKLDQSPIADRIIHLNDEILAYSVSASNAPVQMNDLITLLDQSSLQKELAMFLQQVGLPSEVLEASSWNKFQRLLGSIIEDVPLLIDKRKGQPTRYVQSVSVKNLPLSEGLSLNLQWSTKFHTQPEGEIRLPSWPYPDLKPRPT